MLFRTYSCGRGTENTNSHILYNAMDVSVVWVKESVCSIIGLSTVFLFPSTFSLLILKYMNFSSRPTSEFPHPLSRVKQPAGYRVSSVNYRIVKAVVNLGNMNIHV